MSLRFDVSFCLYGFSANAALVGKLLMLGMFPKVFKVAGTKAHPHTISSKMSTFKINGWDMCFNNQILSDFRNGWIDYRDAFHAVLHLYHCVMG